VRVSPGPAVALDGPAQNELNPIIKSNAHFLQRIKDSEMLLTVTYRGAILPVREPNLEFIHANNTVTNYLVLRLLNACH